MHLALVFIFAAFTVGHSQCGFHATYLRVEHLVNPIGLTQPAPRLSWEAVSDSNLARNQSVSGYEVIVSSTPTLANQTIGDLWDSGRINVTQVTLEVVSHANLEVAWLDGFFAVFLWCQGSSGLGIAYNGKKLDDLGVRVYWRVRLWNGFEEACEWSVESAWWETGPATTADWQGAQWITQFPTPSNSSGCGYYDNHPSPLFRREFNLNTSVVDKAVLHIAGLGYYLAWIDGQAVSSSVLNGAWTNYSSSVMYTSFDVSDLLAYDSSSHALGVELGNGWWNPAPLLFWGSHNIRDTL
jgi:alpha-L-rhamnosidase